jgi:hypothetical protein
MEVSDSLIAEGTTEQLNFAGPAPESGLPARDPTAGGIIFPNAK